MQLTKNFNLNEFRSRCGAEFPVDVRRNIERLANALQVIRDEVKRPVTVTSGYRSPAHNKRIKGADNSKHLKGEAADIRVNGLSPRELAAVIERLIAEGRIPEGGLGIYPTWVHFDIRGTKSRWGK